MEILTKNCIIEDTSTVATIGFFDGVHLGHKFLLDKVVEAARSENRKSLVVTFSQSPKKFFVPDADIKQLNTVDEKTDKLHSCGIDYCLMLDFDEQISRQSAAEFLSFLKQHFGIATLFVGYDHTFGSDRIRDFDRIKSICNSLNIQSYKVEPFRIGGQTVSSSRIREFLHWADLPNANSMLGYTYHAKGTVVQGQRLGRTLGFPTANIEISPDKLMPCNGVYAGEVAIDGEVNRMGMLNIGNRPTVGGINRTVEVNIFDFDKDIYGKTIRVAFKSFLREERRFGSLEELRNQLGIDKRTILGS